MSLQERLNEYVRACFTGIWIESHEHQDALTEIAQLCHQQDWRLATWDIEQGLQLPGREVEAASSDPLAAIRSINSLATPDGSGDPGAAELPPLHPIGGGRASSWPARSSPENKTARS